jgi:hypothetical protein
MLITAGVAKQTRGRDDHPPSPQPVRVECSMSIVVQPTSGLFEGRAIRLTTGLLRYTRGYQHSTLRVARATPLNRVVRYTFKFHVNSNQEIKE